MSIFTLTAVLEYLKKFLDEEFVCPICLEFCTDTHINPDCNHRFCGKCIKESLRKCNKECPSCRVPIPTHRTCRGDPQFDRLVSNRVVLHQQAIRRCWFYYYSTCTCSTFTNTLHPLSSIDWYRISYHLLRNKLRSSLLIVKPRNPQQQCQVVEEEQLEGSWQRKQEVLIKEQRKARRELHWHQQRP